MKRINISSSVLFSVGILNTAAFLIHHGPTNLCIACFCAAAGFLELRGYLKRR